MINEIEQKEFEKVNPFLSIWLSPRKTVRYVLEHKDLKYSLTIAAIAGIPSSISIGIEWSMEFGISWWVLLIALVVLGPILGLIGVAIGTVIYTWVGKWFGGVGTFKEMAQAMGVVVIPTIWFTPYWILMALIAHTNMFATNIESATYEGTIIWLIFSSLISITYSIWMLVIQSKSIGEVHQFSSWRGFATITIPSILFFFIIFFVVLFLIF